MKKAIVRCGQNKDRGCQMDALAENSLYQLWDKHERLNGGAGKGSV